MVERQEARLAGGAADFKQYMALQPDAKLILGGHADERGTEGYNQALSERRAVLVKRYLVEHGVPADKIETRAYGKDKNLTDQQVKALTAQNPNITPQERERVLHQIVLFRLANNRRVDIRLSTGQKSQRFNPFQAEIRCFWKKKNPRQPRLLACGNVRRARASLKFTGQTDWRPSFWASKGALLARPLDAYVRFTGHQAGAC